MRASRRWLGMVGAAVVGVAAASAPPRATEACINGVEFEVDPRVQVVARAEGDANEGRLVSALKDVAHAFHAPPAVGRSPLSDRALLVAARAIARTRGRLGWAAKEATGGETAIAENVAFAARVIEERVKREASNGTLRTDLGEILASVPARRAEARTILEDLEQRKLMASAHGYAALVRLRDDAGQGAPGWASPALAAMQKAPRALAMARCLSMAKEKSICDASTSRSAPSG